MDMKENNEYIQNRSSAPGPIHNEGPPPGNEGPIQENQDVLYKQ